ncbi:hypothetical protein Q7W37_11520 [Streptococcus suis]|nr:hypothetical protein [Streptococcus suis]
MIMFLLWKSDFISAYFSKPSGNEDPAFDGYWKPGGRTYPGDMPEAVVDEVSWGDFTIKHLGGN